MRLRTLALVFALSISHADRSATLNAQPAQSPTVALSDAVLSRLPDDWRQPAGTLVKATAQEQQRFLTIPDDVLRQTVVRLLVRTPRADAFVRQQLAKDPSPRVRTTIVQAIAADARWMALPHTAALIERVVSSDADPSSRWRRSRPYGAFGCGH
jgi:tartrate-resistant acid phosphatase type 5